MSRTGFHFGWFYNPDDETVYRPISDEPAGPQIFMENGDVEQRFIGGALEDIESARSQLWNRLAPLEIDEIEIYKGTELFSSEYGSYLRAEHITLNCETKQPHVKFYIVDSDPDQFVEFSGEQLDERVATGELKSKEQIHTQVMGELDDNQ